MLRGILRFWYVQSAGVAYSYWQRIVAFLESTIAVTSTITHFNEPLFGDYSVGGRFIGYTLRLLRIVAGLLAYATSLLVLATGYLLWISLPPLSITIILGSLIGNGGNL
jgi:hypothetical protein